MYLGHVISGAGVATDPGKIQAVAEWCRPQNLTELKPFWASQVSIGGLLRILLSWQHPFMRFCHSRQANWVSGWLRARYLASPGMQHVRRLLVH